MLYLNNYTNNLYTAKCIEMFGARAQSLSIPERCYLLADVLTVIDEPGEVHDDYFSPIVDNLTIHDEHELIVLQRALCSLLDDLCEDPLEDYLQTQWTLTATDCYGNCLQDLSQSEIATLAHAVAEALIENQEIVNQEELDLMAEQIELGIFENWEEAIAVARALSEIIQEDYENIPDPVEAPTL